MRHGKGDESRTIGVDEQTAALLPAPHLRLIVTAAEVFFDCPAPFCAAFVSVPDTRAERASSQRPDRDRCTFTVARPPGAIENLASPRTTLVILECTRCRTVSFV